MSALCGDDDLDEGVVALPGLPLQGRLLLSDRYGDWKPVRRIVPQPRLRRTMSYMPARR
jgi:hypothetical protein